MKIELVKLEDLSGLKCAVYSLWVDDDEHTLFDQFVLENIESFRTQVDSIRSNIENMASLYGPRKHLLGKHEGNVGDGLYAFRDDPDSNLRLYFIKYSESLIILGGGGHKPYGMRTLQEDSKLTRENYLMRNVSKWLQTAVQSGEIQYTASGFSGQLAFDSDDL